MASHVVIVDSSFRRANIKCTPNTFLSDVLVEACQRLKLPPEQYGLKHNKKTVDLSRTFRFAGLPSGAQLELVQASRSAAPINVALQLPPSESNSRLTAKFPSTTSVWQILRAFESGAAGGGPSRNFTQRGAAQTQKGTPDAGRLYYEMPVVNILGRELASFTDLQKTMVQLGVTSGSALLRLDFRNSGQPLEEAMADISEYFKPSGEADPAVAQAQENPRPTNSAPPEGATTDDDSGQVSNEAKPAATEETPLPQESEAEPTQVSHHPPAAQQQQQQQPTTPESAGRAVKIFLAPKASTSPAAIQHHDESDYIPTIEQAQQHLARLNSAGRNQRLPSDAELAKREADRRARLNAVQRVKVRLRLPDQTSVETEFSNTDSGNDAYNFIRKLMTNGGVDFSLRYVNSKGAHVSLRDGPQKLVAENGWTGNILVNLVWGESVPAHVRQQPVLRDETRRQAIPMAVSAPEEKPRSGGFFGKPQDRDSSKSVEAKLKSFLGLGKRK